MAREQQAVGVRGAGLGCLEAEVWGAESSMVDGGLRDHRGSPWDLLLPPDQLSHCKCTNSQSDWASAD